MAADSLGTSGGRDKIEVGRLTPMGRHASLFCGLRPPLRPGEGRPRLPVRPPARGTGRARQRARHQHDAPRVAQRRRQVPQRPVAGRGHRPGPQGRLARGLRLGGDEYRRRRHQWRQRRLRDSPRPALPPQRRPRHGLGAGRDRADLQGHGWRPRRRPVLSARPRRRPAPRQPLRRLRLRRRQPRGRRHQRPARRVRARPAHGHDDARLGRYRRRPGRRADDGRAGRRRLRPRGRHR